MTRDLLAILRCPYCGGRLTLVESSPHYSDAGAISDGILGCHCCVFPVVAGIPVMHLEPSAVAAREQLEAGRRDRALLAMFALEDAERAARFAQAAADDRSTYRDIVEALGPGFEGGYFLYRFSDPTFLVADAVVRAIGSVVCADGGRAIDLCGGSGHLTRSLLDVSTSAPVVADLYFSKLWLARRFTAPGCEAVCYDGNGAMPFAAGAFRFAVCSDAFHYIWTKRLFASEMMRALDPRGAAVITHAHNALQWNPSAGNPLPPAGYRDLFDAIEPRLFGDRVLLNEVIRREGLDLSRRDPPDALDAELALTIVATARDDVFARHPERPSGIARGELRINPLYAIEEDGDTLRLRLRFPSEDYEQEYGACREYLPEELAVPRQTLELIARGRTGAPLGDLISRRVVVDLPKKYY